MHYKQGCSLYAYTEFDYNYDTLKSDYDTYVGCAQYMHVYPISLIHLYSTWIIILVCDEGCYIPGSLSSIVMNAVLGETITTASGLLVEIIATLKYSDSSVVLSSMVDTIKVAYI